MVCFKGSKFEEDSARSRQDTTAPEGRSERSVCQVGGDCQSVLSLVRGTTFHPRQWGRVEVLRHAA